MPETVVSEELWRALTEALGLPEDADAETAVAAVEDLVTTPPADPKAVAAAAAAAGLTTLDADTLAQLRADAERGRTIAAAARKREIAAKVDDAITKGKITPPRRQHWITMIEADETMADTLASMPNELVVPLTEMGYAGVEPQDETVEQAPWFR